MPTYAVVDAAKMQAGQPEDISVVLANFQAIATVVNALDGSNFAPGLTPVYASLGLKAVGHTTPGLILDDVGAAGGRILFGDGASAVDATLYRRGQYLLGVTGSIATEGAAGGWGFQAYATGEGNPRAWLRNDGQLWFGPGSGGLDTALYRESVGVLKTNAELRTTGRIYAVLGQSAQIFLGDKLGDGVTPAVHFGPASDVILYRSAAGQLQTDSHLAVGGNTYLGGDTLNVYNNGHVYITPSGGAGQLHLGADTSLYRAGANALKTDGQLQVVGALSAGWTGSAYGLVVTGAGNVSIAGNLTVGGTYPGGGGGGGALTSSFVFLTGDVGFANAGTLYDGCSLTLAAGTYILIATANILSGTSGTVYARLTDGTTTLVDGNGAIGTSTAACSIPLHCVVSPAGSTTYKIQGSAGNSGVASLKATASVSGVANKATYIYAIKIA